MEPYTKLTLEIVYDDGEKTQAEVTKNRSDLDVGDLFRMFRGVLISQEFQIKSIEVYLPDGK